MSLDQIIQEEAQKLDTILSDDAIPMFHYAFSKLGTIDEYLASALQRVSRNLSAEKANEARVRYLVHDILDLAHNGARDGGFITQDRKPFVDAYLIWLVISQDYSLKEYLRNDLIQIPGASPHKFGPEILGNKIEYPAYSGLIIGYVSLAPFDQREQLGNSLNEYFRNSPIEVLNLNNVYNELIRLSQGK